MDVYVIAIKLRDGEIEEAFSCTVNTLLETVAEYIMSRQTYGGAKIYAAPDPGLFKRGEFEAACLAGEREDALRATILEEPAEAVALQRVTCETSGYLCVDAKYGDIDMQLMFTKGGWEFISGLLVNSDQGIQPEDETFALHWAEAIAEVQAALQAWLKENTPQAKTVSSAPLWES